MSKRVKFIVIALMFAVLTLTVAGPAFGKDATCGGTRTDACYAPDSTQE